jgi:nucleoside-diphosphate-sugar epimerase
MAELCGEAYAKFDKLNVYRLRFFGITGVGKTGDVVNDFAEQAAKHANIHHGDLSVARDISDVRDVIPAFDKTVRTLPAGTYYIGRGEATPIKYIAEWFNVPLYKDPARVRDEAPVHCSPSKTVHGRPIEETLQWVYDSWKKQ